MRGKVVSLIVAGCLAAGMLGGCGAKVREDAPPPSNASSSASSSGIAGLDQMNQRIENVKISSVQCERVPMWNPNGEKENYKFTFTAENKNDFSTDVTPIFEADVTYIDSYGTEATKHVIFSRGSLFTDYGINNTNNNSPKGFGNSFGLAAGEKKNIVYTLATREQVYSSMIDVVDDVLDTKSQRLAAYLDVPDQTIDDLDFKISNFSVTVRDVKESELTYVSAEECAATCHLDGLALSGSLVNATDDRWKSAKVLTGNFGPGGELIAWYYGGHPTMNLSHVDRGATATFMSDNDFIYDSAQANPPALDPIVTLIAYEPDTK